MSSLEEEERLVQMVHDFIESDTPRAPRAPIASKAISLHSNTCLLVKGIFMDATEDERNVYNKAIGYVSGIESNKNKETKRLMMRLRMDGYDASLCRSSLLAIMDYPQGDYEYIAIVMHENEYNSNIISSKRLIVDIDFKSHFELARPTKSYTKLYNMLPKIFVGSEEKLKKVVSLVCSAGQQSLKENGLHIPPWRKSNYMQSKWLSCFQNSSSSILYYFHMPPLASKEKCDANETMNKNNKVLGCLSTQLSQLSIVT